MSEDKPYRLVPQALPAPRRRAGVYERIIEDFAASGADAVLVVYGGKSPNAVYQGLYHALRGMGRTDIIVRRREGEAFLVKTTSP